MSEKRQRQYLEAFLRMRPETRQILREIYTLAHQDRDKMGRHVILAMTASVTNAEIFRLTLFNIVTRLALKGAMVRNEPLMVMRITEIMDDFHKALDGFAELAEFRGGDTQAI